MRVAPPRAAASCRRPASSGSRRPKGPKPVPRGTRKSRDVFPAVGTNADAMVLSLFFPSFFFHGAKLGTRRRQIVQ